MKLRTCKMLSSAALLFCGVSAIAATENYSLDGKDFEVLTSFTVDTSVTTASLPQGAFALWNTNPVYESSTMDYNKVSHDTIAFMKPVNANRGVALTNVIMVKSRTDSEACLKDKYGEAYTSVSAGMGNVTVSSFSDWKVLMNSLMHDECVLRTAPVYNTNIRAVAQ